MKAPRPFLLASAIALSSVGFGSAPQVMAPVAFPGGNGYIVTTMNFGHNLNRMLYRWVRNGSTWQSHQLTQQGTAGYSDDTSPSYSASGKRVVFVRNRDIYVVTNAGNTTRLTRTKANDADPTYTPDGHIVWTAGKRLHEMKGDGSHPVDLGIEGHSASVSPDGKWVAYTRFDQQQAADHIFKAHLDGTHVTDLTPRATTHQQNPDWSPDGTHLVFQQLNPRTKVFRLAVMRADGSHRAVLASVSREDLTDPVYSPNGKKVAFVRPISRGQTPAIFILDLATGHATLGPSGGSYTVGEPTWQPT